MGDNDLQEGNAFREEEKRMIAKKSLGALVILGFFCMGLLCGCGLPSGDAPPPTPGPVTPVAASIDLQVSSSLLNSDGASTVALTATVKDKDNVALEGSKVSFTADSGLLTVTSGTTGANGMATATLGTGGDPTNRVIHLTASTGSVSATNTVTVVTGTLPTKPTGLTVTAVTSTQINLSWTASVSASVTGYKIFRDGTYLKSVITTSASDTGLTASTPYCYAISAFDSANNESARTAPLCATTYGPPPAAPAGVTASAVLPTQVDLSWTASAGAAQYKIYRNGVLLGTSTAASYADTTAIANTLYSYTVTAIDATGSESPQSTQSPANTGLTVPSNVLPTVNLSSQITVTWTNSGGVNVRGYKVYQNGTQLASVATTSIVSAGLTAKSQYCYTVSSTDSAGNESAKSGMACTNTFAPPPAAPTNLTTSAVSPTQVDLSWTASTNASQYRIYRNDTLLASTTATSYSDTAAAAAEYTYAVTAVEATGSESGRSNTSIADTRVTVPRLAVAVNSITQIALTLTDTGGAAVTGFKVYRNSVLFQSVAKTTTTIVDSGLTANTQYCYAVSAIDVSGKESARSGSVCAITNKPAPASPASLTATAVGASQINLTWPASVSASVTGYNIYRGGSLWKAVTTTSYSDTGLATNTRYCYAVSAVDIVNNESPQTSQQCATTVASVPPTPTGLTATAVSATRVDLAWTGSAGATGYNVYRNNVLLGSVPNPTTSVSDMAGVWSSSAPLPPSTHMQYCYSVSAFATEGSESLRSTAVCLATP